MKVADREEVLRLMLPRTQAFGRLIERYLQEGPFVCAADDPDALLLAVAGKRIVSIDQSHMFVEDPSLPPMHKDCDNRGGACLECRDRGSAPPTKCPDCGAGVHECNEDEPDRAPSGCFHCNECGWMREPWQ